MAPPAAEQDKPGADGGATPQKAMDTPPKSTSTNPPSSSLLDPDLTGRTLGDFHILRRLGQGGMGQVYLAEQISLKRNVALKLLRPELAANPTSLTRFKREAEAVAKITHANIVQVYSYDQVEGLHYMALEYVEGRNLRDFVLRKGPPDVLLALSIMRQVAAALQRASESGIIHRDIKPENILLTKKGEVKVADFGLSRSLEGEPALNLTQSGVTMGTPLYMSPEQVEGKTLDCRTDIYSFGVTCYTMLAGHPPFQGQSAFEVALQHVRSEPKPLAEIRPDLPPSLCDLIHKMMSKDPASRYQTGKDLLRDLIRLRESLHGQTTFAVTGTLGVAPMIEGTALLSDPAQAVNPKANAIRWSKAIVLGLIVVVSLFLAAGFGSFLAAWNRPQPPADRSNNHIGLAANDTTSDPESVQHQKYLEMEEERALRSLVEKALSQEKLDPGEILTTVSLCRKLGLLYLKGDRLVDADRLFTRLETLPRPKPVYIPFHLLGKFGRGIVLALKDRPEESMIFFKETVAMLANPIRDLPRPRLENVVDNDLRYWIAKALEYNVKNGILEKDIPKELNSLRRPLPKTKKD